MTFLIALTALLLLVPATVTADTPERTEVRNWGVAPIPILGLSPDLGGIIGLAGIGFYGPDVGVPEDQRQGIPNNTVAINSLVTTNGSVILALTTLNYFARQQLRLTSRLAFSRIPRIFHGIGPASPPGNEEPEDYLATNFRTGAALGVQVLPNLYVGPSAEYQQFALLERESGGVLATAALPGSDEQTRLGLVGAQVIWDSTGGGFSPDRGFYIESTLQTAPLRPAPVDPFVLLVLDLRHYITTRATAAGTDVIAMQALYQRAWGDTPFFLLPALGGDDIFRGHLEGRFRDNAAVSLQAEYRLPVSGRFGMTGFASVGQVGPSGTDLFRQKPVVAGGVGLRFALNREQRLNLRLDIAFSSDRVGAVYINAREAY